MKASLLLLSLLLAAATAATFAQPTRHEARLTIDNDAFLFSAIDRYYSSGIFASLKTSPRHGSKLRVRLFGADSTSRENYYYQFAHVFFTPYNPKWTNPADFDRPYAGWVYFQSGWQGTGAKSTLRLSADLGLTGPATRIQPLQHWWHDLLGFRQPRGWNYQINNSPSIHASFYFARLLLHHPNAEIYWETSNRLGTVLTQSTQGLSLRLGQLAPFHASVWGGNRLSSADAGRRGLDELFFYLKERVRYRLYDATVEGNFIGQPSLQTETLEQWLFHHQLGFCLAFSRFDFAMAHNVTSRETPEATYHQYITFDFFFRF